MATRTRLSDIVCESARETISDQFDSAEAAADFASLPSGTYEAHVQAIGLFNAKTGTPGVKIQFKVAEGEHAGRMLFHDCWLTGPAMPQTKRDLNKLGIKSLDALDNEPVPPGRIRCKLRVSLRTHDNGEQHNRVRRFDVLCVDEPTRDEFAPSDDDDEQAEETPGDLEGGEADGDASFDAEALEAEADAGENAGPTKGGA